MTNRGIAGLLVLVALVCGSCPIASGAAPVPVPVKNRVSFSTPAYNQLPQPRRDVLPKVLSQTPPQFPKKFRGTDVTGQATIEFIIDVDGRVIEAQIAEATDQSFGEAAKAAVEKWKFRPAMKDGVPTFMRTIQLMKFAPSPGPRRLRR